MSVALVLGLKLFGGTIITAAFGLLAKQLHAFLTAKTAGAHSSAAKTLLWFLDDVTSNVLAGAPADLQGDLTKPETYQAAMDKLGQQALAQVKALGPQAATQLEADLPALLASLLAGKSPAPTAAPAAPAAPSTPVPAAQAPSA